MKGVILIIFYPMENKQKIRITAVDTKSIESLCTWLNCQPNAIMEVIRVGI